MCLSAILICISWMMNDVKHLFVCLLTTHRSFAKFQFKSFACEIFNYCVVKALPIFWICVFSGMV